jgi:group II intron reverse transcriptase/maturase
MRYAETVLAVIQQRGKQGLPLEDIYRQLYNPDFYLKAYARLYSNEGAMTPGVNKETVDGMSMEKINTIIETLRYERYRWTPLKRVYIPKKNGKLRPLGLPRWSDKLLGDVIRQILEAYYDCQFSDYSHGFRPGRGCHTALSEIYNTWLGTKWFIEGDISQFFDKLDTNILLEILREKLHDNRFIRLIENMLKAGYLQDWKWHATLSGCPQGGVASPILSSIYLDKLDKFVEEVLLPKYNQADKRRENPEYKSLSGKISRARKRGNLQSVRTLYKEYRQQPSTDPVDPHYRRLKYVRYCDDFLLGFAGPKVEAEEIKKLIREFLRDKLKLELSEEKTLITHATTQAAKFLGYDVTSQIVNDKIARNGRRCINAKISLRVPLAVIQKKCLLFTKNGKPYHRKELTEDSDFTIVNQYQSEYRGLVQYYQLAHNIAWFAKLHWVMKGSLLRTLANKHKSSVTKMANKYKATTETAYGIRKCLKVVVERGKGRPPLQAQFGGIPLRREKKVILIDQAPWHARRIRTELLKRLLAEECELCGSKEHIEVHHIRKLADLNKPGRREKPEWVKRMAARRRKTLVVCNECHNQIHAGKSTKKVETAKLE